MVYKLLIGYVLGGYPIFYFKCFIMSMMMTAISIILMIIKAVVIGVLLSCDPLLDYITIIIHIM